ncbi:family 20 glycosylhydrolase [Rhizobium sp. CNPSo 3464]|uniref:beta-N-acetylhexosaminidase n=1 Tax=Rhizobium sp. CNPSo 3464 TaxID=3021406 RepID=UPI002550630C|nr:family 20 glycosylhydrolase [Rhizobium sp. CNPSo 3464]MDK4740328.1 family 20 glycosylhydrolase [Rhizobium sp. CNPSo 3464]
MTSAPCHLEACWEPIEGTTGRFEFTLFNFTDETLTGFRLAYTSLTRTADTHVCQGATLLRRNANFHEYAPPAELALAPGEQWTFRVSGLTRPAKHCTDGVKSAYMTLSDGRALPVTFGDLMLKGRKSTAAPALLPEGRLDQPFSLLPWPAECRLTAGGEVPVALYPAPGSGPVHRKTMVAVLRLFQRLFPAANVPFSLTAVEGGVPVIFASSSLSKEGYALDFSPGGIRLTSWDAAGLQYGLTTLAQMLHGARTEPARFKFPVAGRISDQPRYAWRGCHLDVSRQFYPAADISRLLDILAWNKLNIFHWHLTDDEAWRIEIKAYPALTTIGARRGPNEILVPQLGDGAEVREGHYSQETVREIVAHAAALHIEIIPEIDIPGHCTAALMSIPELADGQEAPDSYRSVQGYPNNALNPAIPATYEFLGKVFDELIELFPSDYVHVGGDEVANGSWLASPLCRKLMDQEGIEGTFGLQSYFLGKVKAMLDARGRKLAGWNEVAHGGGVNAENTLLMAWENQKVGIELAHEGYDVVITPGQAYYLDMVQAEDWQEPGASWAGTVPLHYTYTYEAEGDFPDELKHKLKGIQACIWSENFISKAYFNHLVFPRLNAIAEAAWTPKPQKDWERFAAITRLSPLL